MLLLNPESVRFGSSRWDDIEAVAIDRSATRLVIEWSDAGAHAVFADAVEQRINVRLRRPLVRDAMLTIRPGEQGELQICCSPTAGDGQRRRIRVVAVVTGVTHDISRRAGATQTIELVCISNDGVKDPVTTEDASDGSF